MTAPRATGAEDFDDFFEQLPLACHIIGPDGVILRANQAELALLGYAEDEYVGRAVSDFRVGNGPKDDVFCRLLTGEDVHGWPAKVRCRDGSFKDVVIDASGLWREGEFVQARCFTREVVPGDGAFEAERLRAIVDFSDDAIISKDLSSIIQTWNAGAERIFGYSAEEAVGKSIRMLIPDDRQEEEDRVLAALRRGERIEHYDTVRRRKDGTFVDISLTVSPLRDATGRIIGASKIARDISIRKRAEEAIERSMRLKDDFVSLVSHELRTPISVVVGNGNLLLRRGDSLSPEQVRESLEDIVGHGERLQDIIENLLLLTRVEKAEQVPVEPVHLEHLVQATAAAFSQRSPGANVRVTSEDPAPFALAEPGLLRLVVENLLSNAVKYSPPGSTVDVTVSRSDGCLEVHVLDRGIGLDDDVLESIFTPFYRATTARDRAPGLGLGLAVCQRAIVAQGGTISASRREGGGSDFVVRLLSSDPETLD